MRLTSHLSEHWLGNSPVIRALAGSLLILSLGLVLLTRLSDLLAPWMAGVPLWLAAILLAPAIKSAQKKQIGILLLAGMAGLIFAAWNGSDSRYLIKAVEGNQLVVSMLIGVSFLRLVALSNVAPFEQLPKGSQVLRKTLWGTHLFTSVLNISAVLIVGDRLAHARKNQPLDRIQGLVLLRAFSTCAVWSPFFASMGVTLISAPGSHLATLILFGLPIAVAGLLISHWELGRHPEAELSEGYPMDWSSLWMPMVLAVLVISAHLIWPNMTVLTLVTLTALLFSIGWLILTQKKQAYPLLLNHVKESLPAMCSEIALFLGAAMLAAGVSASLDTLNLQLAPTHFGAPEACITLAILIAAAIAGMHPVTSVVLAGSLLSPTGSDANLLGLTLLMGWSLGVGLSPLSGIQLTLQARLGVRARDLLRDNLSYGPLMFLLCCGTLFVYDLLSASS
ncbi:MAG: hypothetical protein ACPGYX_03930 [Oceanobacter sp.]